MLFCLIRPILACSRQFLTGGDNILIMTENGRLTLRSLCSCSMFVIFLTFIVSFVRLYFYTVMNQIKSPVNVIREVPAQILFSNSCQNQSSLRDYCQHFLGCRLKTAVQVSTDLSILDEIERGSIHHDMSVNRIPPYVFSTEFMKFEVFHNTASHRLSIYSLPGSIYLVRVPVLDTLRFPNNDSNLSYVFPASPTKSHERTVPYFERFNSDRYSIGWADSFQAAFIIAIDALAHSFNSNIIVLTCSRAIAVMGCSSSDSNKRLAAAFPSLVEKRMCSNNRTGPYANIISVNKLAIIAHSGYGAFYHLAADVTIDDYS